ncbi:MAG: hypothetical protein CGEMS_0240 [Candidatus Campylobacter infans]|nr:MAG: hypothetical protein CGEMS_0240 [Candidatus Campylobacter infans]
MTIRELCKYINITTPTLYNWKQEKPNLYKIIENFNKQEQNMLNKKHKELINIFDKLTEKEQEYYLADMKTRILKKEIE